MTTKQRQHERETAVIRAPHDGSEVGVVALAGPAEVRVALDTNVAAARAAREMPSYARAAALRKVADDLEAARAELARTLALEAGKPISQARTELDRAIAVFRDAAEEATRIGGEVLERLAHRAIAEREVDRAGVVAGQAEAEVGTAAVGQ